jgi:hypothetical protein
VVAKSSPLKPIGTEMNRLTRKRKVIARKLDGQVIKGYLKSIPDLTSTKNIAIVSLTEEVIRIPKEKMKALFFVRKFCGKREYSEVKLFETQPKIDGLWVRLTFYDDELLEGLIANSIRFLLDDGFYLKPPDPHSNNRLIYVVKAALRDFSVLGVQYSKGNMRL